MRELVPRERRDVPATPWTTYVHETPNVRKRVNSVSPSPVPHSKTPVPPSPFLLGYAKVDEPDESEWRKSSAGGSGRVTPSVDDFPHDPMQLPVKSTSRPVAGKKSVIDILEAFIADLPPAAKENVRATYNGNGWPNSTPAVTPHGSHTSHVNHTPQAISSSRSASPQVLKQSSTRTKINTSSAGPTRVSVSGTSYLVNPSFRTNRFLQPNFSPSLVYSSISYVPLNRGG